MAKSIFIAESYEQFYEELQHLIKDAIHEELAKFKKDPSEGETEYIKKNEVCKMLQVSRPTIDRHVENGFYSKYHIGSRVFYKKREIIGYLEDNSNTKFDFSIKK